MKKFTRICAALVVSFGPLVSTITEVNARPFKLAERDMDRITAGRLATEAEIETWIFNYVQFRKSQGKVSTWEKELSMANLGKRVSVVQGGKNATGEREARLSGGNTAVFRLASGGALQQKFGKEWVYREKN